jgi:hypothetical protein
LDQFERLAGDAAGVDRFDDLLHAGDGVGRACGVQQAR